MSFKPIGDQPSHEEFIGYNAAWVHEDYNKDGTRMCLWFADEEVWQISMWDNSCEEWISRYIGADEEFFEDDGSPIQAPTHWCEKPKFSVLPVPDNPYRLVDANHFPRIEDASSNAETHFTDPFAALGYLDQVEWEGMEKGWKDAVAKMNEVLQKSPLYIPLK